MRIAISFMACFLLVACDGTIESPSEREPGALLSPCPGFVETGKPPLVQGAECGELLVYENTDAQSGAQIALNIMRLPAVNPMPKTDPLFIIAGGPGQSAVDIAEQLFYVFNEVRKNRDIVFVDQRGTGKSSPLNCTQLDDIDQQLPLAQQKTTMLDGLRECATGYGARLEFYTTPYAVQDLDAVRRALGYQQLNLWGVSYGTRVALEYMRRYPESVRTSILDGVAPVTMALPWTTEVDALAALEKIQQQCLQLDDCVRRYGDLLVKANAIADRLYAQAIEVETAHPRTRLPYRVNMNHQTFAGVVRMALYSRDLTRMLPLAIHEAYEQDYKLISALISLAESRSGFSGISLGMHYTVICNEDYAYYHATAEPISENFLRLGQIENFHEVCAFWPQYNVPEEYFSSPRGDTPTLLLSGARDPVTPPRWAEATMEKLTHAQHAIAPGGAHSITRDGCAPQLIAQFIHKGSLDQLDTQCINNILPLQPYHDLGADILAELQRDDKTDSGKSPEPEKIQEINAMDGSAE
jgi:pimeloyl-ACP methyl ester carboxylesterase